MRVGTSSAVSLDCRFSRSEYQRRAVVQGPADNTLDRLLAVGCVGAAVVALNVSTDVGDVLALAQHPIGLRQLAHALSRTRRTKRRPPEITARPTHTQLRANDGDRDGPTRVGP